MRYAVERLGALEKELENLECDLECARDETRFFEELLEQANKALAEMWQHVPDDKRRLLMKTNDYIEELFWNG